MISELRKLNEGMQDIWLHKMLIKVARLASDRHKEAITILGKGEQMIIVL